MRAMGGETDAAIKVLLKSKHNPTQDIAGWNHYVDATAAFLNGNLEQLTNSRKQLAAVPYPEDTNMPPLVNGYIEVPIATDKPPMKFRWPPNIDVVDGLFMCFGKSYKEAYSSSCRILPP